MTNEQPIHILNQMGVITAFSVAKKVTESDIHHFFAQYKKAGKKDSEIEKMLREKILSDIQEAVMKNKVPGLLTPTELSKELGLDEDIIKNAPELNRIIMVIAHKLSEKKYGRMSLCYFINGMVNALGLTEKDFEKFHSQNHDDDDDDDDDDKGYKDA